MIPYKRVYAAIDLDAVTYNMNSMKMSLPEHVQIAGVVKTDGYGHGSIPIAKAIDPFVSFYCVATKDEAIQLRMHNIDKPIMLLGPVPGDEYEEVIKRDIRPSVFTLEQARAISDEAVLQNKKAYIHIALDTGMSRIGMKPIKENADLVRRIVSLPNIVFEGLFTHMFKADEEDKAVAYGQVEKYKEFLSYLDELGLHPLIKHISNSAGLVQSIGTDMDMVRAGITIYGIKPSDQTDMSRVHIKPVMSLKSTITYIKEIEKGSMVSYGGTYIADKAIRVATIPVGYGDGYPRDLSNVGYVLIDGKRAPILGRICMDQFMVDVSDITQAKIGSEVTLLGFDGADHIYVEELSALCHRFPYEFTCDISKRVPRVYLKGGKVIGTKDYNVDYYKDFI